jgi:hypothetical protein
MGLQQEAGLGDVTVDSARTYARLSALRFIQAEKPRRNAEATTYFDIWRAGEFSKFSNFDGMISDDEVVQQIYDYKGRLLFRDFVAKHSDGEVRIRTAANEALGVPVISLGINAPLPIDEWTSACRELALSKALQPVDGPEGLICYSYPKLGLLCKDAGGRNFAIDLADKAIFPLDDPYEAGSPELATITWSPYDQISAPVFAAQREKFKVITDALALPEGAPVDNVTVAATVAQHGSQQKILSTIQLEPQKTPVYCAVAVARMLLRYHGIDKSQDEIAELMHTGETGTPSEQQILGYNALAGDKFIASLDHDPSFVELQEEINSGRPLKLGTLGHARAIAGWQAGSEEGSKAIASYYVFDPWPVGEGRIYWEFLGTCQMLNYIFIRRNIIG